MLLLELHITCRSELTLDDSRSRIRKDRTISDEQGYERETQTIDKLDRYKCIQKSELLRGRQQNIPRVLCLPHQGSLSKASDHSSECEQEALTQETKENDDEIENFHQQIHEFQ